MRLLLLSTFFGARGEREKEKQKQTQQQKLTLQHARVLADRGAADAGMALDLKVVSQGAHHLLDLLGELARRGEDEGLALEEGVVEVLEDACGEFLKERAGREREKTKSELFFLSFSVSFAQKIKKKKKTTHRRRRSRSFPSRTGPAGSRRGPWRTARCPSAGSRRASRNRTREFVVFLIFLIF